MPQDVIEQVHALTRHSINGILFEDRNHETLEDTDTEEQESCDTISPLEDAPVDTPRSKTVEHEDECENEDENQDPIVTYHSEEEETLPLPDHFQETISEET